SPSWSPSQTSPVPSPSASSWPGLNSSGQLSSSSGMPSLSSSSSQRLPTRSPSVSVWSSLSSNGQLSNRSHQLSLSALAEGSAAQPGYRSTARPSKAELPAAPLPPLTVAAAASALPRPSAPYMAIFLAGSLSSRWSSAQAAATSRLGTFWMAPKFSVTMAVTRCSGGSSSTTSRSTGNTGFSVTSMMFSGS